MEENKLQYFKEKLERLYQDEEKKLHTIKEELHSSMQNSLGELSLYDNHPADAGDETFVREQNLGFIIYIEERMALIEEALQKIEEQTYGVCKACGKEIRQERLEMVPYANLCQYCKRKDEDEGRSRPIEERMIKMSGKNISFDGEDAWQAVARYGTSNTPVDIGSISGDRYTYEDGEEDGKIEDNVEKIAVTKGKDGQFYGISHGRQK